MADKPFRFGPAALANAAADILHVPAATPVGVNIAAQNLYGIIRHIRIVNKTAAGHNFSLFIGVTGGSAAGTEVVGTGLVIAANTSYDYYGQLRLDNGAAEFLTGFADAVAALTIEGEGVLAVS